MALNQDTIIELGLFLGCIVLLVVMLKLLIDLARKQMIPRPVFVKPDRFRNYEEEQNWSWDFVFVFQVRNVNWHGNAFCQAHTLRKVIEKLKTGKLETFIFKSQKYDKIFVKIRATSTRLKDHADKINYNLKLDELEVKKRMIAGMPDDKGGWKWWPRADGWEYPLTSGHKHNTAITDEKKQSPYLYFEYIYGDFKPEIEDVYQRYQPSNSIFRGVDRIKLIMSIIESPATQDGCGLNLTKLTSGKTDNERAVLATYPLHDSDELLLLQSSWITFIAAPWKQPTDMIKDYFGEKIALYFCWLGHYTTFLIPAAVLGVVTFVTVVIQETPDAPLVPWFAVLMALWATFFLEFWKRAEKTYAMKWGMCGFEDEEEDRPEFDGIEIRSPVDGSADTYFPAGERTKRDVLSKSVILTCGVGVLSAVLTIFFLKAILEAPPVEMWLAIPLGGGAYYPLGSGIAAIINAVQIQVMNGWYNRVALYLNGLENHRKETNYEDALIGKTFIFQFVNSYMSLFYIAFLKNEAAPTYALVTDAWGLPISTRGFECKISCMYELSGQLATIFVTRLLVGNITEVGIPYVKLMWARAANMGSTHDDAEYEDPHLEEDGIARKRQASPAEEQFELFYYDQLFGTFYDYAELVIQYGYATLFVAAFPLAPLMAFVNNYIEIRIDAWKLCQNCRRPMPSGAEDIGTWQAILEIMSVAAVMCNCALVAYTGTFLSSSWRTYQRVMVFILLEHALFWAKSFFALVVDDVPPEVDMQIERQEFIKSRIVANQMDEDLEDDDDLDIEELEVPPIYDEDDDEVYLD